MFLTLIFVSAGLIVSRQATKHGEQRQTASADLDEGFLSTNARVNSDSLLPQIKATYGDLPLSFEPNRGQTDSQVKFLSRADNRTLWLTRDAAVLAVVRSTGGVKDKTAAASKSRQVTAAVLRMKFLEANADPSIEGEGRQAGTVNYFFGKASQWRTRIPTYARVRYRQLYPGIDLVFYGNNRQLEYDLVVAPGADPERIKLAVDGTEEIRIAENGNLLLKTAQGEVIQEKPKIYQRKGARLVAVSGNYVITGRNQVGFRLGTYDRRAAVVIDPVMRYATFLGGNNIDEGRGIGVDSSNRAVVGGLTCSLNFPRTVGPTSFSGCSIFITKFDFTGTKLVFSTFIGESAFDVFDVGGMALDSQGNSYATGFVEFRGFPTTPGAFQTTHPGGFTGYVVKLSPDGTRLIYSTFLGGNNGPVDSGNGIAADSEGHAYVIGSATSSDFPTTSGAFQPNCKLVQNTFCQSAFVTKLSSDGSRLDFSTFLGGAQGGSSGEGIAVDKLGNVFLTGATSASDFPTTAGSAQSVFPGGQAAFVSELSSSGSHLVYSTFLGGGVVDTGKAIAVDSGGNAFATGETQSTNFPVKNAFQPHCAAANACFNAFVTKLNPDGRLVYSTYLGGPLGPSGLEGKGTGIAVTPDGKAYVIGKTSSQSFPTTQTAFQRVLRGSLNAFLTKLDSGGQLIYSSYLGGDIGQFDGFLGRGPSVALDPDTNAYVTGTTLSSFPATPGSFQTVFGGGDSDAFVAKVVALCALNPGNRTVTLCAPANGSAVKSPVNIVAGTTDATPVKLTQIYLDGKKIFEVNLSAINVNIPIAAGTHRLTVQALDTSNVFFKTTVNITVH
jgi:hypothetical protein